MRFINFPFKLLLNNHLINYPTPINLNYFWGFGSITGLCLTTQILTGICLAMHYSPHTSLAFSSVEHIMRDVNNGWLFRYIHANGASMFFIAVYTHIGRGLYYRSYLYPRAHLWISGIFLFTLMMATAFMGYVLPWGQMSFWGATVITNLFSAIPMIGQDISYWLWGGFSVDNATLNRFFSLHYLLPFFIVGLVLAHLSLLHLDGSNNPLGLKNTQDKISFYPYFYIKDFFGLLLFWSFFALFVYYKPNLLGHPDNYIKANPLVTPPHIVPEWYFLPFYAILRSIPDKLGGVMCMGLSIKVLSSLPILGKSLILNPKFNPLYKVITFFFLSNTVLLGWLGGMPAETPFVLISQVCTFFYFSYFFFFLPILNTLEKKILTNF
jgi:quinol-cytochrome oxidoreductase complex cytochrome b subunit